MIKLENIYLENSEGQYLFNDINIFISSGSLVLIKGNPSQGKTRLMKTMAMIEKPKRGKVSIMGKNIFKLEEKEISNLHKNIGIVFQEDMLLKNINVYDNISLPLIFRNEKVREINLALKELIPWLNLGSIIKKKILDLSSSEKKLVQFARAIIGRPRILLLDNFFNSIHEDFEKKIVYLILALNRIGTTVIIFGEEPIFQKLNFNGTYFIKNKTLKALDNQNK